MTLLRIDSSARASSVTRYLTAATLPPITDDWLATYGDPAVMTSAQREYLSTSDRLIDELFAADLVVIGAPMYNLTIPAPLTLWGYVTKQGAAGAAMTA
jgi:FMN-dependent NADH-azoreductase